jgi:NAD(P)-dependent dehydrogenase (short-subunit alcohol dehydrogenase family)
MAGQPRPLEGLHALVTGGGTGIGAATALALAQAGARVSLAGRRMDCLRSVARELGPSAGVAVSIDVTDEADVGAGIEAITAQAGHIDVLVNNAGQASSAPFDKTTPDLWSAMLAVNLTGAYLVTRAVLTAMMARGSGRVINIASTAGLTGYPYVSAYVAAKHGLIGLTRAIALEVARSGITVNAVCPGFTNTALLADAISTIAAKTGRSKDAAEEELARRNPMGRFVSPEEVANAVVWLASPGASAVNGQSIVVAGGEVMAG